MKKKRKKQKKKSPRYLTEPAYGNCLILAPDGQALCRTSHEKIDWYLERSLGEIVCDDPRSLRLKFEPSGRLGADHPYMTAYKHNICVVCGGTEKITRHHVVPICFRRFLPLHLKRHKAHDVVLLCVPCHDKYEEFANTQKKRISEQINIPINGTGRKLDSEFYSVRSAANALLNCASKIPLERQNVLYNRLKIFFKKEDISQKDLIFAASLTQSGYDPDYKTFGQCVIERMVDTEGFIKEWRMHFVDCMKPKFLPDYWDIDHPV